MSRECLGQCFVSVLLTVSLEFRAVFLFVLLPFCHSSVSRSVWYEFS